jgi:SAM-dependent methyltransferase
MLNTMRQPGIDGEVLAPDMKLRCPRCGGSPEVDSPNSEMACNRCSFPFQRPQGIWLTLPAERERYYAQFVADYELIRAAEGRGSHSSDYYLALPYRDISGKNQSQWMIRARTYDYLVQHILPEIQTRSGADARVLDVGAGNGWLSYRLALMGFRPTAVDLLINDRDGLGAAEHYREFLPKMFPCFQAESTRLPFADSQFDAVIFNASFHYAEDYAVTLAEALRCLAAGGTLILADSPWYSREASGEQMLAQRRTLFFKRFRTSSDSIRSQEFLTDERLTNLESMFGIRWVRHTPSYGMRWALRPWVARLRRRREPARFRIYTTRKVA